MARNYDVIMTLTNATASANGADQTPSGEYKGAIFYASYTEDSGTATVDIKLQAKSVNGDYYDIPGAAFAQISATGTQMLTLYPGIGETANVSVSDVLPSTFRAVATWGGAGQYDLRLEAEYIP